LTPSDICCEKRERNSKKMQYKYMEEKSIEDFLLCPICSKLFDELMDHTDCGQLFVRMYSTSKKLSNVSKKYKQYADNIESNKRTVG
jgi:uncharacterized protein YfcZ (UPF0381/DUF406 family)